MPTSAGKSAAKPFEYPEDAWLSGYFLRADYDVKGTPKSLGQWKNRDFLRLKDFALHLLDPRPGIRVLDLGCSEGATMVYCGLQGAEIAGQDLEPRLVERATALLHRYRLSGEVVAGDARLIQFADRSFDGVVANDFLEHVDDATKVDILREVRRVLKPGGIAVIRTPNLAYLRVSLWYKRVRAILRLENPAKYVIPHTPGTHDPQHIGLTTRQALTRCLLDAGFVNYSFYYAPLRRFGASYAWEVLSTEVPIARDWFCEDLVCVAYCPITLTHFPN